MYDKDIAPVDENNTPNGCWEIYYTEGDLWYKINYIDGEHHGLHVWFFKSGKIYKSEYYAR
jgi:antitoxin component YwqK of YwqJK toxin-antitoxin module